jgi:hypothetical protein
LRRQAANADNPRELQCEINAREAALPEVPVPPRVFVEDCTPEALALRLWEHGERMAVISDEGGFFDPLTGRYSNGVPNFDIYLKAHSGSPYGVDRKDKTKPPLILNRPLLVVVFCPQPDVIAKLSDKPGFLGRGLLARILYVSPKAGSASVSSRAEGFLPE